MQTTSGAAVLAAPLAHTDRRALSQAWYSALHLAERAHRAPRRTNAPRHRDSPPAATMPSVGVPAPMRSRSGAAPVPARHHADRHAGRRTIVALGDCRPLRTMRARPIALTISGRTQRHEQAFVSNASAQRADAAFTLSSRAERIRLHVRGDTTRLRLVAVCAVAARVRVERTLAQARFVLAGCGVRVEAA